MKNYQLLWVVAALLCLSQTATAQVQHGKPSKRLLSETRFEYDHDAPAAYLFKTCRAHIFYDDLIEGQKGFKAELSYHHRIKFYKKEGFQFASDEIELFNSHTVADKLVRISIVTYTLKDGKIERNALRMQDVDKKKTAKGSTLVTFKAIALEEGSVVDIKYTVKTPYLFSLPTWYFQAGIPVYHSSYTITYPDFIEYEMATKGFAKIKEEETSNISNFDKSSNNIKTQYTEIERTYTASHVSAFFTEPFLSTPLNYVSQLDCSLVGHQVPGGRNMGHAYTWKELGSRFMGHVHFGGRLDNAVFLENPIADKIDGLEDKSAIAMEVFEHITQAVTWNKKLALYCRRSLKDVYESGQGNTAELNLLLVAALKKAGINAFPVLVSTKEHGFVNPLKPSTECFNTVVTGLKLEDDVVHTLDGTTPLAGLDILPNYCLNQNGLRIGEFVRWVPLLGKKKEEESYMATLSLDEDEIIRGKLQYTTKDYAAHQMRLERSKEKSTKLFIRDLDRKNEKFRVLGGKVVGLNDLNKPVQLNLEIELTKSVDENGDEWAFHPIFINPLTKNPFKEMERQYPVELPMPIKKSFVMMLELPEGFEIKKLPKAEIVKLPNGGGKFSYNAVAMGAKIQLVCSYSIDRKDFTNDEYKHLRSFYEAIISKQKELIVLKKTSK